MSASELLSETIAGSKAGRVAQILEILEIIDSYLMEANRIAGDEILRDKINGIRKKVKSTEIILEDYLVDGRFPYEV